MGRRRTRERETTEYLDMLARLIRAAGRRVADADEVELGKLLGLQHELDQAVAAAIEGQRGRGASWSYIATATGITKQTAWERWGKGRAA